LYYSSLLLMVNNLKILVSDGYNIVLHTLRSVYIGYGHVPMVILVLGDNCL